MLYLFEIFKKRAIGEVWVMGGNEAIFLSNGGELLNSSIFSPTAD